MPGSVWINSYNGNFLKDHHAIDDRLVSSTNWTMFFPKILKSLVYSLIDTDTHTQLPSYWMNSVPEKAVPLNNNIA